MRLVDPLIREHGFILRKVNMLALNKLDLKDAVDFFKTYADKCHHGKEEDILFKALLQKGKFVDIVNELMEEHKQARLLVADLANKIPEIVSLYKSHIAKETKALFLHVDPCFSEEEKQKMLTDYLDFDKNFDKLKYEI